MNDREMGIEEDPPLSILPAKSKTDNSAIGSLRYEDMKKDPPVISS